MRSGFSLVELSIVLVILGLLVGGVLAGQSLIRAAELRSVSTAFGNYTSALHAFRDKYFALPGDMTNATSFWGDQATGTAACASASTANGTPGTCNGNSNGGIEVYGEAYRAWQHLAMAGLVEGSYLGYATTSVEGVPGIQVPSARISSGGYGFFYATPNQFMAWPGTTLSNYVILGASRSGESPVNAILAPEEAWNIDTKGDDGMPGTGRIVGGSGLNSGSCVSSSAVTATYVLSFTGLRCGVAAKL